MQRAHGQNWKTSQLQCVLIIISYYYYYQHKLLARLAAYGQVTSPDLKERYKT